MKPGVTITKDDTAKVLATLHAMTRDVCLVGIPAPNNQRKDKDGVPAGPITNSGLGYLHEFGAPRAQIPPRPFLVPGMKFAEPKLVPVLKAAAQDGFQSPGAINKGLNRAGLVAAATVKQYLTSLVLNGAHTLADSTLAARKRKGFQGESPLIRTGQLRGAITYVVRSR